MALSSLLEIVSRAADELVIDRPSAVIAGTTPQVRTLLACAQAAGRDLMRAHNWTALQSTGTLSLVNGTATYALADDYDRMLSDTAWDRTNDRIMIGPDAPQKYFYLTESGVANTAVHKRFRVVGTNVIVWPTPTASETAVYAYISNKWARSAADAALTEFAADTDTTVFDPDLVKAEIKWRFSAARGMYADALKAEAKEMRESRIAADIGGSTLNMAPPEDGLFVDMTNVSDGNWDLS